MTIRRPPGRVEATTRRERAPTLSGAARYRVLSQNTRAAAPACLYRRSRRHRVEWIGSATTPCRPAARLFRHVQAYASRCSRDRRACGVADEPRCRPPLDTKAVACRRLGEAKGADDHVGTHRIRPGYDCQSRVWLTGDYARGEGRQAATSEWGPIYMTRPEREYIRLQRSRTE